MLSLAVPAAATAPSLDPTQNASTWDKSSSATLVYDIAHAHQADENTVVHVTTDGKFLYVRFDAGHRPATEQRHGDRRRER